MIKFGDIKKTLLVKSIQLSVQENQLLIQRAAREMAERSVPGAIIVPLCFALAVITSGYFFHSPYTCTILALILMSSAGARCLAITRIKSSEADLLSKWVQVFFWSCLGMASVWGIITAVFIYTYTGGFPVMLVLILSAGIGAGAMMNFCIWRPLAVNYLLLSFVPGGLAGLLIQQPELLPTIAAIAFFVFYLLAQTKYWNFHFWDSLVTAYLFERQAEKLSNVNSKLAEIIEKEQKLRREVEKSRVKVLELFNLTHDAIVICSPDGRALDFNHAALEMLSGVRDEILNTLILQFITIPDDGAMTVKDHWEKAVAGQEDDFECTVTRPGKRELLHVLVNLRRLTWQEDEIVFVTLRDITAKKHVEETLRITQKFLSESEGYLQAILRNIELPIYCKDLEGCYLTVNKPFETLCCLTLGELRGKNDMEVFPENVGRFFSFRDSEIVETGESTELEGTFIFGGQEKNLLVHKFPLKERSGAIYATAGICTDVTIMKKALHTAQLANEAKSEFLAGMSHEIRTPMHSILSVARLGLKRVGCSPRAKLETYFKMIVTSGDQLLELLSELLDLSTLESTRACYNLAEYDLSKDLEKVAAEFKVMMDEKEIALSFESQWYPAPARYDKTKLYQVLRNLLVNAMKFTAPKKEVKIVLKKDFLEKEGGRQPAWKVMVVDQGIGVEKDELELVFGKFVRGSKMPRETSGVGLGLSICKRIVEDHHGMIWAEQNEPEGTIFCFLLPALDYKDRD
jgi:PAS domain S-box-containing protein